MELSVHSTSFFFQCTHSSTFICVINLHVIFTELLQLQSETSWHILCEAHLLGLASHNTR
jgi:hypothetical protein